MYAGDAFAEAVGAYRGLVEKAAMVRFHTIGHARIENIGKSQSCMVSQSRMMWKQGASREIRARMTAHFTRGCEMEWMFWDAAQNLQQWPVHE